VIVASAKKEATMLCPKCGKEGVEPGDAFCRHCGFSLSTPVPESALGAAEKKSIAVTDWDASKGLLVFGAAMFLIIGFIALVVGHSMGLPNFAGTVLPWLAGALMLVGLVMMFLGFELRPH
jgi:ribosomal protein L37E